MTLKPQCDCSTCDACANAPGRSGYCLNCEVTDSGAEGSHAQHTPGPIDWSGVEAPNVIAAYPAAHAELVRRWNTHEVMVEALRYALPKDDLDEPLAPSVEAKIRAALAAAEGGATKHVHSFSIWHDRQDRPARGYSRCACGVEPGDDWAEAK